MSSSRPSKKRRLNSTAATTVATVAATVVVQQTVVEQELKCMYVDHDFLWQEVLQYAAADAAAATDKSTQQDEKDYVENEVEECEECGEGSCVYCSVHECFRDSCRRLMHYCLACVKRCSEMSCAANSGLCEDCTYYCPDCHQPFCKGHYNPRKNNFKYAHDCDGVISDFFDSEDDY
jgi:hypothetical protein